MNKEGLLTACPSKSYLAGSKHWVSYKPIIASNLVSPLSGHHQQHHQTNCNLSWFSMGYVVSCPDPTLSEERVLCHKPESLGLRKCWSLVIVSVELQIDQCWIQHHFERYDWSACSHFRIIPINAALRLDWPLYAFGAGPRISTCDTRPLSPRVSWVGSGHETSTYAPLVQVANINWWLFVTVELTANSVVILTVCI